MILFPNAKINIGLKVLNERQDGYHNIKSILYAIPFCDFLEINWDGSNQISYSGLDFDKNEEYLSQMIKWVELKNWFEPINIHLHKIIPVGSGLGGGSSDLASLVNFLINKTNDTSIKDEIRQKAIEISVDTAFFLNYKAAFAEGKGDLLKTIQVGLKGFYLLLIFSEIEVSTAQAYKNVKTSFLPMTDWSLIQKTPNYWKDHIHNDFELSYSDEFKHFEEVKSILYEKGSEFVSLSGTGSTIYAIFKQSVEIDLKDYGLECMWVSL